MQQYAKYRRSYWHMERMHEEIAAVYGYTPEQPQLRQEIDRLKQQLRDKGDRIAELNRAIEAMRVAGGSVEFQMAFDMAKALIVAP